MESAEPWTITFAAQLSEGPRRWGGQRLLFLQLDQGDQSRLRIHLVNGSHYYGGWYQAGVSGLDLDYWGPLKNGTTRTRDALEGAVMDPDAAPGLLADVLIRHSLAGKGAKRSALRERLTSFNQEVRFVDGLNDEPTRQLSLASAQKIARSVRAGDELSKSDRVQIKRLLRLAPVQFGWWGPLKTMFKHLDPAFAPKEFGMALGRLAHGRAPESVKGCEDISFLSDIFDIPSRGTAQYMARRMIRELERLAPTDPATYAVVVANMLAAWDSTLSPSSLLPAEVLLGGQRYRTAESRRVELPADQSSPRHPHHELWREHSGIARQLFGQLENSAEALTFAWQVVASSGSEAPEFTGVSLPLALRSTDASLVAAAFGAVAATPEAWERLSTADWNRFFTESSLTQLSEVVLALLGHAPIRSVAGGAAAILRSAHLAEVATAPMTAGTATSRPTDRCPECGADAEWDNDDAMLWCEECDREWEPEPQPQSSMTTAPATSVTPISEDALARLSQVSRLYLAYTAGERARDRTVDLNAIVALALSHVLDQAADTWASVLIDLSGEVLMAAALRLFPDPQVTDSTRILLTDCLAQPRTDPELIDMTRLCMSATHDSLVPLAWRLLHRCSDRSGAAAQLFEWVRSGELPAERKTMVIPHLLAAADPGQAGVMVTELVSDESWGLNATQVAEVLGSSDETARTLWNILGGAEPESARSVIDASPQLLIAVGNQVHSDEVLTLSGSQQRMLANYLRANENRIRDDRSFGVAAARVPAPDLQRVAIAQLTATGGLADSWLMLAESALPLPLEAARGHLGSLRDRTQLTESVLAAIDSLVGVVRDLGLELLDARGSDLDSAAVWNALTESDDAVVQERVAEEALVGNWSPDDASLAPFDRRVLVARRRTRRAKEAVKSRMASATVEGEAQVGPERLAALRDMAAGTNRRDSEWALQRLALLSLQGVDVDGISVSLVSGSGD